MLKLDCYVFSPVHYKLISGRIVLCCVSINNTCVDPNMILGQHLSKTIVISEKITYRMAMYFELVYVYFYISIILSFA